MWPNDPQRISETTLIDIGSVSFFWVPASSCNEFQRCDITEFQYFFAISPCLGMSKRRFFVFFAGCLCRSWQTPSRLSPFLPFSEQYHVVCMQPMYSKCAIVWYMTNKHSIYIIYIYIIVTYILFIYNHTYLAPTHTISHTHTLTHVSQYLAKSIAPTSRIFCPYDATWKHSSLMLLEY